MFLHSIISTCISYRKAPPYIPFFNCKMVILGGGTKLPTVVHSLWLVTLQLISPNSLLYPKTKPTLLLND